MTTIICLGCAGAGKSTFLNHLINEEKFSTSDNVNIDGTTKIDTFEIDDNILVDTPGLDSINHNSLYHIYSNLPKKNNNVSILLCIPTDLKRYTGWTYKLLEVLKTICSSINNVNVVWTFFYKTCDKQLLSENLSFLKNDYNVKEFYFSNQFDKFNFNDFLFNENIKWYKEELKIEKLKKEELDVTKNIEMNDKIKVNNTQPNNKQKDIRVKIYIEKNFSSGKIKYHTSPEKFELEKYRTVGDTYLNLYLCVKHYYLNECTPNLIYFNFYKEQLLSNEALSKIHDEYNKNKKSNLNEHSKADIFEYNIGYALLNKENDKLYKLLNKCIDSKMKIILKESN